MAKNFWTELPTGVSMMLAKNPVALNYFNGLSPEEREKFVDGTRQLHSAEELRQYVDSLCGNIK